jgi:hypothetical protein
MQNEATQLKPTVDRVWIEVVPDSDPDTSYLEQDEFEDRLEQYRNDEFHFVGVQACAEIRFNTDKGYAAVETIRTPGLWGIEDDSGEDHLLEVGREELDMLGDMLASLGLASSTWSWNGSISYAF